MALQVTLWPQKMGLLGALASAGVGTSVGSSAFARPRRIELNDLTVAAVRSARMRRGDRTSSSWNWVVELQRSFNAFSGCAVFLYALCLSRHPDAATHFLAVGGPGVSLTTLFPSCKVNQIVPFGAVAIP
jgi:hypothetical protein